MKSIHDIRRKNLIDLIERDFNGVQTRLAERLDTQPNLVNRWARGTKIIGDQSARKIDMAANKPTNWLDTDHELVSVSEFQPVGPSDIGLLAAENLARWMRESRDLSTQGKLSRASGVAQSTLNRMLNNEASITLATLEAIAAPFGRRGYELLIHPKDPAGIRYDRTKYASLPESEKSKIESFIDFVITQHANNQL
ncbi:helix-turn-helix transcriptional regulator [Escherichia sp. E2593]|uniref:helix-turn-helix domain-containing protein n=1 Tax=unclassified Escherichia TaxID=2608889 RepID=UPI0010292A86|nr:MULTISPECIES: helix-turn-helix transcriptional regulator [unclassified Escherichia]RZN40420.1 XRE family transcriptional regulator [Escherichia sp. E10V5]TGC06849.1 transcriptional regulator [Escherichia sp. E2593]TLI81926.1 helix-turn-helix transcriptional regulator [Escherichia sp. E2593]